jgi:hypothetical protein
MAKQQFKLDLGTVFALGAGVAIIITLSSFKQILNKLGLGESKETKELDKEASDAGSPWYPAFWKKGPTGTILLNTATMQKMYETLQNAWGYFDDDEEAAKGVIKSLKTQSQLSFFSDWLMRTKNIDLFEYMRGGAYWNRLEDSDMDELVKYIDKLPKYK